MKVSKKLRRCELKFRFILSEAKKVLKRHRFPTTTRALSTFKKERTKEVVMEAEAIIFGVELIKESLLKNNPEAAINATFGVCAHYENMSLLLEVPDFEKWTSLYGDEKYTFKRAITIGLNILIHQRNKDIDKKITLEKANEMKQLLKTLTENNPNKQKKALMKQVAEKYGYAVTTLYKHKIHKI